MSKQIVPAAPTAMRVALLEQLDALYRYALILTHSRAEAEDLVQETCMRALRAESSLQEDSNLKSWFFTILRNLFFNERRRRRRHVREIEIDDADTAEAAWQKDREDDPESLLLGQAEREQVRRALLDLPPLFREILLLREWEELEYSEIATILGCPVGTVMSRLSRAREKVGKGLKELSQRRTPEE